MTAANAARARVVERAAAKGRKAGAEHHASIEQVGIGHHLLAQAGRAFVDQREDQAIGEIGRAAASLRRAHRLAVLPGVEALTALAAELAAATSSRRCCA